jgi:hypothetical protein
MDGWKDTYTFTQTDTDGRVTLKTISGNWVTLNDLATAFSEFLQGAGYTYVEDVDIITNSGDKFGSD